MEHRCSQCGQVLPTAGLSSSQIGAVLDRAQGPHSAEFDSPHLPAIDWAFPALLDATSPGQSAGSTGVLDGGLPTGAVPASAETSSDGYAASAVGAEAPPCGQMPMPPALSNYITDLDKEAENNRKDSDKQRRIFWTLKIPTALFAASSGLVYYFELQAVGVILGFIAA